MGVKDEAQKYAAVLGHNYPGSQWYEYAYNLVQKGANEPVKPHHSWVDALTFEQKDDPGQCNPEDDSCFGSSSPGWFDKLGDWF